MGVGDNLAGRYYLELAAAFVRGSLPEVPPLPAEELVAWGLGAGLRLHRFKRTQDLPRVRKVLGILRGLAPADLLDVGSGRGVFLWPLLDGLPWVHVTAVDRNPVRGAAIQAVIRGGIDRLATAVMDAARFALADKCADVVTILEVLEHLPRPERALAEAVRLARQFVVVSVPSKEDDNPEHIHLFTRQSLQQLFTCAGVGRVQVDFVLNHMIAVARV